MQHVLQEHYYNLETYLVQTRYQTKTSGIKLPEVHGIRKSLDPNIKPEKQQTQTIKGVIAKPHIGQGRAGFKRSKGPDSINQAVASQTELSKGIPEEGIMTDESGAHTTDLMHPVNNANKGMQHKRPRIPDVPIHLGSILRCPPKPIRSNAPTGQQTSQSLSSTGDTDINSNTIIEF